MRWLILPVVLGVAVVLVVRGQLPMAAQDDPQPTALDPAAPALHCTATSLPVGRAANVWRVACTLSGAPADDTGFEVRVFADDGPVLCTGELGVGEATCEGSLTVPLDETSPALQFLARTSPSETLALDPAPVVQPPCSQPPGNRGLPSTCP